MVDIHKSRERLDWFRQSVCQRFSEANAKTACRFVARLRMENKSLGRIANYADCTVRILKIKDDAPICDWSREDIEHVHHAIADSNHANSVKKGTVGTLKRIYHFAVHNEIPDKSRGEEYDAVVSWIIPGRFTDRYNKIQPQDLLTDAELLKLVRAVKKLGGRFVRRDLAALFLMLEGAYRPGELFNIRIGGIEFEDDYVRVHTTGKTGPKSLALVASFEPLREWIAEHPYGDDPDAFLLYAKNKERLMGYTTLRTLLAEARRESGIKKKVWPYLFRHTALTGYSKKLGNIVKIYGNWSPRSNALATYEHLANSDQEDAVLTMHGLKKPSKEESILFFKLCPSCKARNTQDKSHCTKCGRLLEAKTVHERDLPEPGCEEIKPETQERLRNMEQMILALTRSLERERMTASGSDSGT